MSDPLRSKLIRLAYAEPSLRSQLLPLLKQAARPVVLTIRTRQHMETRLFWAEVEMNSLRGDATLLADEILAAPGLIDNVVETFVAGAMKQVPGRYPVHHYSHRGVIGNGVLKGWEHAVGMQAWPEAFPFGRWFDQLVRAYRIDVID